MKNWQEKQYKKQLEHYSPKRTFNYEVDLELPTPVITLAGFQKGQLNMFLSVSKSTRRGRVYPSMNWLLPPPPWKPSDEIMYWLYDNVGIDYYMIKDRGILAFTKPEDAIAFKLMWR